ncbi:LysM peptidoglycan-binding domain-containing protein [Lacticaseibacillus paracasei]|uniref:LysM peptidoglycan-binding domain-containing protein n=2 Tax=Lacticaseibacillus paracasei TaxID=1597 RepID=UPI00202ED2A5|nr:LysM peptidoglycan-binding domain-containing protein [Lacticaseibacillus paracasei]URW92683.1 LysM peptidoglycan-binding domain-containing protein [Lacticaseibacillus paracasei]
MKITRKQRQLQLALEEQAHRVSLVHSKHHGWLALGLTSIGFGVVGLGLAGQTNVVNASSNQQVITKKEQSTSEHTWTLRPVSQIEAQIKASDKKVYDIQWGDTLSTISEALNNTGFTTSVDRLAEINHIANVNLIYAGAKLYLQGNGADATVTTKDAAGNYQTYNLNPAKPVNTPSQQAQGQNIDHQTPLYSDKKGLSTIHKGGTTTTDKSDIEAALKASEEARKQAAAEKAAAEKAKQEAEAKLTELLNAENGNTLTQLQAKRTAAQTAVETAKTKVAATSQALTAAQQAYAAAKQAADTAAANVASKQAQVDAATNGINAQTTAIQSLQSQLDTINKDAQAAKDQAVQAKVAALKADLAKAQQGLTDYETQLNAAKQQLDQANQAGTAANDALTTAKAKLDSVQGDVTAANTELQTANTQLAALPQSATSSNSDQAKVLKADLAAYDQKIAALDQSLQTYDKQIQDWQAQLKAAQDALAAAKQHTTDETTATTAANANDTKDATKTAQTTIDNTTANMPKAPHVPVHTDKQVTVKVDEQGHTLTDTTGYKLMTTSAPVQSVQTLANGDTITTYTTTETYHQIQHFNKQVTVNVDAAGNPLTSTDGYTKVAGAEKTTAQETVAANGDVTTTTTTTVTWQKTPVVPGHKTEYVTKNVDEAGQTITLSAAYHLLSSHQDSSDRTLADGTIVTTITTTNVYHQIQHFTKQVTVNVDTAGKPLASTDGYTKVAGAEKTTSVDTTAQNGDVTTTTTTTITWKQNAVVPGHRDVYETLSQDEQGQTITPSAAYHLVDTKQTTHDTKDPDGTIVTHHVTTNIYHAIQHFAKQVTVNVDEAGNPITPSAAYHLLSSKDTKADTSAQNGDITTTTTTTNVYHKIVRSQQTVTINKDQATGQVLMSTDGYTQVPGSSQTSSKDVVAANGDVTTIITTTIAWKKTPAHQTQKVTVDVDEDGNKITPSDAYHFMSSSTASKDTTLPDGTLLTTVTTTNVYHKIAHVDTHVTVNKDQNGNVLTFTTGYDQVSESQAVTDEYTAANGDIHRTITITVIWKEHTVTPTDPIIAAIKTADDAATKAIEHQVKDEDTRVDVDQAKALTDRSLSLKVGKIFNDLVNQEQTRTGNALTKLNTLDKDNIRISQRAVEVMYNFNHARPDNTMDVPNPNVVWTPGEPAQSFNTENIAQSAITKASIGDLTADNLATAIAKQMFAQYITNELPDRNGGVAGGHYTNIISSGYDSLVTAVYVVDHGAYYEVASAVSTGEMSTY